MACRDVKEERLQEQQKESIQGCISTEQEQLDAVQMVPHWTEHVHFTPVTGIGY